MIRGLCEQQVDTYEHKKNISEHESNKMPYDLKIMSYDPFMWLCIPYDYIIFSLKEVSLYQNTSVPEYELYVQKQWAKALSVGLPSLFHSHLFLEKKISMSPCVCA
jgi:hypothetical protein